MFKFCVSFGPPRNAFLCKVAYTYVHTKVTSFKEERCKKRMFYFLLLVFEDKNTKSLK